MASSAAVSDLAPTGKLRAAINFGNPVLASQDPATGEPGGISVDLARELARRLGVPSSSCPTTRPARWSKASKAGAWDVCFLAIDPLRASRDRVHARPTS